MGSTRVVSPSFAPPSVSWSGADEGSRCIRNAEPEISIPALGILRNLACGFEEGQQPIPGGRTKELIDLLFTQLSSPNDEVLLQVRLFPFLLRRWCDTDVVM